MTPQLPDDLQPFKRALNNLPMEYYEAILRKYAEGSDQEEIIAILHGAEEYLSSTADPLVQQVKQLRQWIDDVFSNPHL